MHAYYISPGYQSGYTNSGDWDEAWGALVREVEVCRNNPALLVAEVREFGLPPSLDMGEFEMYAGQFAGRAATVIEVHEGPDPAEAEGFFVTMYAAGGETLRRTQEFFGRALCRRLMREMHRLGFEVNVRVT